MPTPQLLTPSISHSHPMPRQYYNVDGRMERVDPVDLTLTIHEIDPDLPLSSIPAPRTFQLGNRLPRMAEVTSEVEADVEGLRGLFWVACLGRSSTRLDSKSINSGKEYSLLLNIKMHSISEFENREIWSVHLAEKSIKWAWSVPLKVHSEIVESVTPDPCATFIQLGFQPDDIVAARPRIQEFLYNWNWDLSGGDVRPLLLDCVEAWKSLMESELSTLVDNPKLATAIFRSKNLQAAVRKAIFFGISEVLFFHSKRLTWNDRFTGWELHEPASEAAKSLLEVAGLDPFNLLAENSTRRTSEVAKHGTGEIRFVVFAQANTYSFKVLCFIDGRNATSHVAPRWELLTPEFTEYIKAREAFLFTVNHTSFGALQFHMSRTNMEYFTSVIEAVKRQIPLRANGLQSVHCSQVAVNCVNFKNLQNCKIASGTDSAMILPILQMVDIQNLREPKERKWKRRVSCAGGRLPSLNKLLDQILTSDYWVPWP
ncbi:hypothetical protein C8J56DRAFT_879551 [Mycena floridula]|nr:hypothetical protein C8J56DRAFT_879551 [Mycena floridula]